jgi:ATP-dependent Lhr-like helicase
VTDPHQPAPPLPGADPAAAYGRLDPRVQRWVYDQKWDRLRTVQAHAVDPVLAGRDVVIAAATASGKTEAAWLPVFTRIAPRDEPPGQPGPGAGSGPGGVRALYLGPLKALINDQHLRLETLGEATGVPVHRWHGDVAASRKHKLLRSPDGVLLITPGSLEALFALQGPRVGPLFAGLDYVVVDELHDFIGTERGAQLQSLLHRVELAIRRRVPRIGLSATLSDLSIAAGFLRPAAGEAVHIIDNPSGDEAEIKLQLRGYVAIDPATRPTPAAADAEDDDEPVHSEHAHAIAGHLFKALRSRDNLVFANSRSSVEAYVDLLTTIAEKARVPNEFFPHHGNLSKEYREDVEARLKSANTPTTAVCTSTLEMGIDIGSTDSVAQIGAPFTVASLRQRLGRSGRRGTPAVLRMYVAERDLTERTPPPDQLRAQLFQTVAMVNLMLHEKWFEPPNTSALHLSTLTQQILSVIAQHGGATAAELFTTLCEKGSFRQVTRPLFVQLLRDLGEADIVMQTSDGLLLAGGRGDQIVNHYTFYTAFQTSDEYRLVARGRTLGSIPVDYPVLVGSLLIFAGRRWKVIDVDTKSRVIALDRSGGGRPPVFAGGGGEVADLVRRRMRSLYESAEVPAYLNQTAQTLLDEGRDSYRRLLLSQRQLVDWGHDTLLFCWRGDRILNTLSVAFADQGLHVGLDGVSLHFEDASLDQVADTIGLLASTEEPDPVALAASVQTKERDKYDGYLSDDLLAHAYAASSLDVPGAWDTLRHLAASTLRAAPTGPQPAEHRAPVDEVPTRPLVVGAPGPYPRLGETPFAVIDLETTGFAGHLEDRVIELAVVHADPRGQVTGSWSTLVNPGRDPGPSHVHRIYADQVRDAPAFAEVADWLCERLSGRVVVAHNAPYDLAFLVSEFERADIEPPDWPVLCTMELARRLGRTASLTLTACCAGAGVDLAGAHTALGDALGAAALLRGYLPLARASDLTDLAAMGCGGRLVDDRFEGDRVAVRLRPRDG